jgi:SAM-dependent methyltransferase
MLDYIAKPTTYLHHGDRTIASFVSDGDTNVDRSTIKSFGDEWKRYGELPESELRKAAEAYFDIVTADMIERSSIVLDLGCGNGRWSRSLADKVEFIEAIDPSEAVYSAVDSNGRIPNIRVTQAGVDLIPFADGSFDFIMCLGVLHHLPRTEEALEKALQKLKHDGHFLLYLYYDLENRSAAYRALFATANLARRMISRLPLPLKPFARDAIAFCVYVPLSALTSVVRRAFPNSDYYESIPLSYYADMSLYVMRNDALDRFGTPLEKRFSREEIIEIMETAGLSDITVSPNELYWHAVGKKAAAG